MLWLSILHGMLLMALVAAVSMAAAMVLGEARTGAARPSYLTWRRGDRSRGAGQ